MNPQNPVATPPPEPQFGYPTNPNPYPLPNPGANKKTILFMIGGGLLLVVLLLFVLFGGRSAAGEEDMKSVMQSTSDALGIVDGYQNDLSYSDTKNNIALVQIILRGNYQDLNQLYNKTYKPKKRFSSTPKADKKSESELDSATRANMLDAKIYDALLPKVAAARKSLKKVKGSFSSRSSKEVLSKAETDLDAVIQILQTPH